MPGIRERLEKEELDGTAAVLLRSQARPNHFRVVHDEHRLAWQELHDIGELSIGETAVWLDVQQARTIATFGGRLRNGRSGQVEVEVGGTAHGRALCPLGHAG